MLNKPVVSKIAFYSKPGETPSAYFFEDLVTQEPDGEMTIVPNNNIYFESLVDPSAKFDVLDWDTEQKVGEMSYGEMQVLLWSAYKFIKAKRDAENAQALPA